MKQKLRKLSLVWLFVVYEYVTLSVGISCFFYRCRSNARLVIKMDTRASVWMYIALFFKQKCENFSTKNVDCISAELDASDAALAMQGYKSSLSLCFSFVL